MKSREIEREDGEKKIEKKIGNLQENGVRSIQNKEKKHLKDGGKKIVKNIMYFREIIMLNEKK